MTESEYYRVHMFHIKLCGEFDYHGCQDLAFWCYPDVHRAVTSAFVGGAMFFIMLHWQSG